MTETEIAWAAGLFDGEGCFSYRPTGNGVEARLGMTDFDAVERFHEAVGVGVTAVDRRASKPAHWKRMLVWRVTNRTDVTTVVDLLSPYLSRRRRERGAEILLLQEGNRRRPSWHHGTVTRVTEEQVREIRKLAGAHTQRELAERFGVTQGAISKIVLRKSWASVQ